MTSNSTLSRKLTLVEFMTSDCICMQVLHHMTLTLLTSGVDFHLGPAVLGRREDIF